MEIRRCVSVEDCALCDQFLTELNEYESNFDQILNNKCDFKNMHKKSFKYEGVYMALAFENEYIGYIYAYLKGSKGKVHITNVIHIDALFVKKDYRNKGIGRQLIDSVECWAKEKFGEYVLELHAINNNVDSLSFYKHLGFKEVRTIFRR